DCDSTKPIAEHQCKCFDLRVSTSYARITDLLSYIILVRQMLIGRSLPRFVKFHTSLNRHRGFKKPENDPQTAFCTSNLLLYSCIRSASTRAISLYASLTECVQTVL
ncbi:hypothetical protein TSAR_004228, partial [Trichomalopsis sarcophagae]